MSNFKHDKKIQKFVMYEIEKCYSNVKSDIRYYRYSEAPDNYYGRIDKLNVCIANVKDRLERYLFTIQ